MKENHKQSLTNSHKQTNAQPVSKHWPSWKPKSPFFLYPSFHCWMWSCTEYNIPLANSGQLSCLCPSKSLVYLLPICCRKERQSRKKRKPWCWAGTVLQSPKQWWVISTVLDSDLKYSTLQAAMKKVNSSPARCSRGTLFKVPCFREGCQCLWMNSLIEGIIYGMQDS